MFITFEGMDGSGKTTQVGATAAYLRERGFDVLLTREPGGTIVGDQIREVLLDKDGTSIRPNTELLLFCASRAQLVEEVIRPHLEHGGVVISDRYVDSSIAYQGYGHGIDLDALYAILDFATGGLYPDLTLYLDIPPEEGLKRRAAGSLFGEEWSRIDGMAMAFHERVYTGYQAIARSAPGRWARINAAQPQTDVEADVLLALHERLPRVAAANRERKR
jgi:dTMP kinase